MMFTTSQLPTVNEDGHVHHALAAGDYLLRDDQTVLAEPGDHIIGARTKYAVRLTVVPAAKCPVCEAAALGRGTWPTR